MTDKYYVSFKITDEKLVNELFPSDFSFTSVYGLTNDANTDIEAMNLVTDLLKNISHSQPKTTFNPNYFPTLTEEFWFDDEIDDVNILQNGMTAKMIEDTYFISKSKILNDVNEIIASFIVSARPQSKKQKISPSILKNVFTNNALLN